MEVIIKNIHHGSVRPEHSYTKGRDKILYAKCIDIKGELLINSTLDYILDAINERGWKVISER